ncbi:winged helix-turn-helix transcriptional regulator [Actinospongicola halichondriae]|uniref:winged helix-turn-helix transcriptional regulator n=1 Tax=Actinospongicola halichondriae TaxID=3236844 RepID=UPI003D5C7A63
MSRRLERSGCPINLTTELLGDSWSLVVLRDVMFGGPRHFSGLHRDSLEGIATNILASRLEHLLDAGLLSKHPDPGHRQRSIYRLTESAIDLVPVMATLGAWGSRWLPVTDELAARALVLAEGGPAMWSQFMDELRTVHLGAPAHDPGGASVHERLAEAFERARAET